MVYLEPAEYAAFGLSVETADGWVTAASAMIEAHCRRPTLGSASYTERVRVGRAGGLRLSYAPLVSVDAVRARFGAGDGFGGERTLLGAMFGGVAAAVFCSPAAWTVVDASLCDVCMSTGEVAMPPNLLGVPYSEVEVTYTAGFAAVPAAVKVACAQVVKNAQATPGLNVKSSRMDTLATEYFSDSLLDVQVRELLRPYVAERLGC